MLIGLPRETKTEEYRVALTPGAVRELTARGHQVLVEAGAGAGAGFPDGQYIDAGARTAPDASAVWAEAELVVKVKEPQGGEWPRLRRGQVLFCFLHLAAEPELATALQESGTTAIAFETVTGPDGSLPLLAPMSEIAGRLAVQAGAGALESPRGGRGVLLGGVPGVLPGRVLVIGGGRVGTNAARMALGLGADVTVADRSTTRLAWLDDHYGPGMKTLYATAETLEDHLREADLVIGAVLVPGARAPRVVTRADLKRMRPGAVLVDVSIDQGGCFETSRPTSHREPTYTVDGVVHYGVGNMPGAVARTATFALANAILPPLLRLADHGWRDACRKDRGLLAGLNVHGGRLTHGAVADSLGRDWLAPADALELP